MQAGISTACFYPRLTEESMHLLAAHGIPCCEIFVNTLSEIEPEYVKELRRIADSGGTQIVSLHPFTSAFEPFMLFTNYERRFRDAVEWHKHYFDAMNLLGARIFVLHGDRRESPLPDEAYYERFAALRDLGKQYGITVAQENVGRCKSHSLDFLENMARYLDGDLHLVYDNKQARRSQVDELAFLERLGRHICHVHISDATDSCDCTAIRPDSVHIAPVIQTLRAIGYTGAVLVELYRDLIQDENAVFQSWKALKNLL